MEACQNGATTTLGAASTGYTYAWTSSNASGLNYLSATNEAQPVFEYTGVTLAADLNIDYTLTVTRPDGCIATDHVIVTVKAGPTFTDANTEVCLNSTITVEGSDAPAATNPYVSGDDNIFTVDNNGLITAVAAGTASVTFVNDKGCSVSKEITVNPLPMAPTLQGEITQPNCTLVTGSLTLKDLPGGTWTLTETSGHGYPVVTGSSVVKTLINLQAGKTYTFQVENEKGCVSDETALFVINSYICAEDDDFGTVNGGDTTTGTTIFDNDNLNGNPVSPADVNLTGGTFTTTSGGITLNPDGTLTVDIGTPAGVYTTTYTICEKANPANCDTATITIEVTAPVIDATDDDFGTVSGADGGTSTQTVFDNDTLNGDPVDPANVTLTGGAFTTTSGPTNCDTATITIEVTAPVIDAVDDDFGTVSGADGGTSTATVFDNDTLNGAPVNPSDVTLTGGLFSPTSGAITLNPDGKVTVAPGTLQPIVIQRLSPLK